MNYKQLILFGSPGTGKSHLVKTSILMELGIAPDSGNSIRTVFHPEYTYGDFIGKLMPLSQSGRVEYNYYEGYFMKALAKAYRNIIDARVQGQEPQNVALIIDEINRGNSAAIFGAAFQLLDREQDGWSTYEVNVSDMEFDKLLDLIGVQKTGQDKGAYDRLVPIYKFENTSYKGDDLNEFLEPLKIRRKQLRIPGNLSIIATMNTSDNSIYHMDSAFKRRWDWQYINIDSALSVASGIAFTNRNDWYGFIKKLNSFIKSNYQFIRKVEDKQIGHWFIPNETILKSDVQNKIMFFLWDSVFTTSKQPLIKLLELEDDQLVTFGDFATRVDQFIQAISDYPQQ